MYEWSYILHVYDIRCMDSYYTELDIQLPIQCSVVCLQYLTFIIPNGFDAILDSWPKKVILLKLQ